MPFSTYFFFSELLKAREEGINKECASPRRLYEKGNKWSATLACSAPLSGLGMYRGGNNKFHRPLCAALSMPFIYSLFNLYIIKSRNYKLGGGG